MRTKNENNVYNLTCKVTGKVIATNPKQFNETASRYGVTDAVLRASYVSRDGRNIIKSENLTAEQAVEKYGLDATIAKALKCMAKPAVTAETPAVTPDANISVEVPATAISAETPAETPSAEPAVTVSVPETDAAPVAA